MAFCALLETAQTVLDSSFTGPAQLFDDDVRHFFVGRWGDAHFVEGLVGAVLWMIVQVDAAVLHPMEGCTCG